MPEINNSYSRGCQLLMDNLYKDRENFTIVALTGYTGTGCSILADLMSEEFLKWEQIRKPTMKIPSTDTTDNEVLMFKGENNNQAIGSTIFSRKYTLCYNFAKANYKPFTVLKYSYALIFYTLNYLIKEINRKNGDKNEEEKNNLLKNHLKEILKDKFCPSPDVCDNDYRKLRIDEENNKDKANASEKAEDKVSYKWEKAHKLDDFGFNAWNALFKDFEDYFDEEGKLDKCKAAALFFDENKSFLKFVKIFNDYLWKLDPYCMDFFYYRLGIVIRATGNPLKTARDVMALKEPQGENLYRVVNLINELIKGYKKNINKQYDKKVEASANKDEKEESKLENKKEVEYRPCRIVIDKLRNSLEAKFLKERYSAFYLIATHEERAVKERLKERIHKIYPTENDIVVNKELTDLQIRKIIALDALEREGKDFEEGKFFTPNLSQCVADAEIHISNERDEGVDQAYFYSMSEQWMKYASLIQHPGLITPSSEERCMVVAYTAKFNSGCISRQVGAVITNKSHSIRTIGWNDVPYGQVPCGLRDLPEMATRKEEKLEIIKYLYSEYETGDVKKFKDGETFNEKVRKKYRNLHLGIPENPLMNGLPFPYCFKSLQNEFEREKNQVHSRSLHAEENAILQMAKYGGEALNQGIIYVTASPCELCCKKLYQIGVRKIIYIDEYPGISRENIIANGYHRPKLKQF